MRTLLWLVAAIGSILGAVLLALGFLMSSAPQQAAIAGFACGLAIVPYVLARAVDELGRNAAPARAAEITPLTPAETARAQANTRRALWIVVGLFVLLPLLAFFGNVAVEGWDATMRVFR